MAWPARRVFRLVWWAVCILTLCALPLLLWDFIRLKQPFHLVSSLIGGLFVVLSIPVSIYEVLRHTQEYTKPAVQRHVIRILWMVPIYSVTSWFAMRYPRSRVYLDSGRECYEAYVIYSFYQFLMQYLAGEVGDLEACVRGKPQAQHMFFVRYFVKPWLMGSEFLWQTKKGTLNYVIIRPVCAFIALAVWLIHKAHGPNLNAGGVLDGLLSLTTNFSQLWSMYCLAMLYMVMHNELMPIRPLSKFVCIKAVVFLTFWQGILIEFLVMFGVIKSFAPDIDDNDSGGLDMQLQLHMPHLSYSKVDPAASRELAARIQEFAICIEMFLAALAHTYAFPPRDYIDTSVPMKGFWTNLKDMFDLRDVAVDVQAVMEDHLANTTNTVGLYGKHAATHVKGLGKAITRVPGRFLSHLMPSTMGASSSSREDTEALLDPHARSETCELEERPSRPSTPIVARPHASNSDGSQDGSLHDSPAATEFQLKRFPDHAPSTH